MPRKKAQRCPLCGKRAHMGEIYNTYSGKTRYAVVCDSTGKCRLSELPPLRLCFENEEDALTEWNSMVVA